MSERMIAVLMVAAIVVLAFLASLAWGGECRQLYADARTRSDTLAVDLSRPYYNSFTCRTLAR